MSSNNDTTVTFTAQQYQMILTLGNAANAAIQLAESQGQPRIGISNARAVQGCPPPVARNRPYVEPKLRGRMVCLANRTARRFLRRAPQTAHAAARSIRDKRAPTGSLTRQRNRYSSSCSQQISGAAAGFCGRGLSSDQEVHGLCSYCPLAAAILQAVSPVRSCSRHAMK